MDFLTKVNEILGKIDPDKAAPIIEALKKPEFAAILTQLGLPDPALAVNVLSFLLQLEKTIQPILADIIKTLGPKAS